MGLSLEASHQKLLLEALGPTFLLLTENAREDLDARIMWVESGTILAVVLANFRKHKDGERPKAVQSQQGDAPRTPNQQRTVD